MSRCGIDPDHASWRLLAIAYGRFERIEVVHQLPRGFVECLSCFRDHDLAGSPQNKLCAKMPFQRADLFADRRLSDPFLTPDGGETPAFDKTHKQTNRVHSIHTDYLHQFQNGIDGMPGCSVPAMDKVAYVTGYAINDTETEGTDQ
ncbi:hypothetical protein PUN4_340146 [Paraburkholderia unamae]|nr:hypothetical protein PUN4_340146 [Paraburkholderia unamae]